MSKNYSVSDGSITYVPEFDGNRDDKDPITVEIRPQTVREAQQRSGSISARRVKGGGFQTSAVKINQETFKAHVQNIKNLSFNGTPVTTAEELLNTPLHDFVDELNEAISDISMLNEGDVKNFKSRSDGYLDRKPGTANDAAKNSSGQGTAMGSTGE